MTQKRGSRYCLWGLALSLVTLFFLSFLWGRLEVSPGDVAGILAEQLGLPVIHPKYSLKVMEMQYSHRHQHCLRSIQQRRRGTKQAVLDCSRADTGRHRLP